MKALTLLGSLTGALALTVPNLNSAPGSSHNALSVRQAAYRGSRCHPSSSVNTPSSTPTSTPSSTPSSASTSIVSSATSEQPSSTESTVEPTTESTSSAIASSTACVENSPSSRSSWCHYDIDTDPTTESVDTGVTREYTFLLTDVTVLLDGVSRTGMAINGMIPGPSIFADWGDTVSVTVQNRMTDSLNGTSMHFNGIRQNYTNANDGVSSVTQCPLAVGESMTYTWKATQYGTGWYRAQFGVQAWEGAFGGIVINGPATANYDEDLGMLFINDWGHQTAWEREDYAWTSGSPVPMDNGLINGTNVYGSDGSSSQVGSRFTQSFEAGKSYRMRLVNTGIDTHFKFSIDQHTMKVIAADMVPIEPYETTVLDIGIGQRYDVIVTADATGLDNYWMRAIPQSTCSDNNSQDNIRGIIYYGSSPDTPTTDGYTYVDSCDDETANLVPYISKQVSSASSTQTKSVSLAKNTRGNYRVYLDSQSTLLDWADPTLQRILDNQNSFDAQENVISLDGANEWVYFVLNSDDPLPNSMHLHGHDFYILAQGTGSYSSSITLNTDNPPRRDTALLPANGYLVLGWQLDNPGVWLLNSNNGYRASEGFGLQLVERYSEIGSIISSTDKNKIDDTCQGWQNFQNSYSIEQEDSGF